MNDQSLQRSTDCFSVELVSPYSMTSFLDVTMLIMTTSEGELAIMKNHAPMILSLKAGSDLHIVSEQKKQSFDIIDGFVNVAGEKVTLVVNINEKH